VVLAKWLARDPKVLLLDEPTRGVDVGAKAEIYAILKDLARNGVALLVVSSELPELMTLADRILVLSEHQIQGTLERADFSEENILKLAYGKPNWPEETANDTPDNNRNAPAPSRFSVRTVLQNAGIGLALLALIIFFSVFTEHFLTPNNITNILTQITINLVLAVGMTFVILIGGIDLSVGSVMAFAAVVAGTAITLPGFGPAEAIALAVIAATLTGVLCGFINGAISAYWALPSFIITLGMLNIARGAALQVSDAQTIYSFPYAFEEFGSAMIYGVPVCSWWRWSWCSSLGSY
jgi:energy-coupling factor transporter ATP-binding protein EcfA2